MHSIHNWKWVYVNPDIGLFFLHIPLKVFGYIRSRSAKKNLSILPEIYCICSVIFDQVLYNMWTTEHMCYAKKEGMLCGPVLG